MVASASPCTFSRAIRLRTSSSEMGASEGAAAHPESRQAKAHSAVFIGAPEIVMGALMLHRHGAPVVGAARLRTKRAFLLHCRKKLTEHQ